MFRIAAQYVIFSGLFTAYLSEILPVQARIGKITSVCALLFFTALVLSFRLLLLRYHKRILSVRFQKEMETLFSLPFRELCSDVVLWILLGSVLGVLTGGAWWITWKTTVQLFCCSLMIGLVVGAFNFLHMQRALILFLREHGGSIAVPQPEIKMSVASRITLLLYSIMAVSALFIGFLVFDEASAIIGNVNLPPSRVYRIIFEIGAVVSAMIIVSIRITSLFTTNLNLILELQTDVLARVQEGTYDTVVPVVTRDEFGIIASRTNEMIAGLRDREHIRDIFGRYMSKEVRDVLLSTGVTHDAETRSVTVLFCDLRGFTSFVEGSSPKKVVEKLNQYFTEMCQAIEKHQGLVLQFIGDEIEAVFGAPVALNNHPSIAVETAIEMRKRLRELNRQWEDRGDSPFEHGIGIHTGEVVAASIGSPERLSYLMVGDTVNLASRIQGMTKDLGCDILISGETQRIISDRFPVQYVSTVRARGKREQTDLFKVL